MKYLIISLVILGALVGIKLSTTQDTAPTKDLNVQKAIDSGGLSIRCRIPYRLDYCVAHPELQD